MARRRLICEEIPLLDSGVLVRMLFDEQGHAAFQRHRLTADATLNFTEFGYFGLSLWAVVDAWPLDRVLSEKCRYSRHVALYRAGDLRHSGLVLIPSGRAPHYDVSAGSAAAASPRDLGGEGSRAEALVDRFTAAAYTGVQNYYFTPRPS